MPETASIVNIVRLLSVIFLNFDPHLQEVLLIHTDTISTCIFIVKFYHLEREQPERPFGYDIVHYWHYPTHK